jgi:hypothetical protein
MAQMDKTQIELNGHRALVEDHCLLVARVQTLEARVAELEYLWSEEIMRQLLTERSVPPNDSAADPYSPAVFDPNPIAVKPTGGVIADSWQKDGWVTQYVAAVEPGFVHSPGYPQDEGACSGADELTDTGLSYGAVAAALAARAAR